jgi:hypothetical protein
VVRGCLGIDLLQPISVSSVNMAKEDYDNKSTGSDDNDEEAMVDLE